VRHGRGTQFTPAGRQLLAQARRILALHDETLLGFGVESQQTAVIGSTEHAAAQLLPSLASALEQAIPAYQMRFRIDRGTRLREGLAAGQIDLALLLGATEDPQAVPVGELELTWYSAPGWSMPPDGQPIPLAAFDEPCALRSRALETLAEHGIPAEIRAEAIQLAGVQAAVGAGLGVALLATLGQTPEGLTIRADLPRPAPLPLAVWSRAGLAPEISRAAAKVTRQLLLGSVIQNTAAVMDPSTP
jgi:DNA-binding transcriptional LysR family regulator